MVGLANVANTAPTYFATAASVNAITPTSLGLGNVANTKPSDLPASDAVLTIFANQNTNLYSAINTKADIVSPNFQGTVSGITKGMVGLANAANTAPSYFATAASVSAITPTTLGLGNVANTKPSDLPASDAVLTIFANQNTNIYSAINTKANIVSPTFQGTVSGITPAMVGQGNLYNTNQTYFTTTVSDEVLNLKAPINNPSFTEVVNTNNVKIYGNTTSNFGVLQHPNNLQLAISSSTQPSFLEVFVSMDANNLYLKAPSGIYCSDISFSGAVSGLTPAMVGLQNVANTAPSYFAPVLSP